MEISLPQKPSHQELELIVLLALLISAPVDADNREIQTEFYHRFKDKFLDRCHHIANRLFRGRPDVEAIRDDVFQETFITALEQIKDFEMDKSWDDMECAKVIYCWLAKIANNKLLKRMEELKMEKVFLNGDYKHFLKVEQKQGGVAPRNYIPTYDKEKFEAVWGKLNPMAQEIILLCAKHETLCEDNTKHLPDDDIAHIIKKYGVTKAALRKTKERTIKALNTCKLTL
jgi:DNA-directed RNA polymerase specialized sigma24 family protein